MAARTKVKGIKLGQVAHGNYSIKVNDCVLINPEDNTGGLPYVGKVVGIVKPDDGGDVQLQVNWFYRPEEAIGGRKPFHGEKELFLSDHADTCSVQTVIAKCRVLSLSRYQELPSVGEHDYFARFTYKPAASLFDPPKVPVFCACELPYNPDRFMVMCEGCAEWYHPECLRSTKAEMQAPNWRCPACGGGAGTSAAVATAAAAGGGGITAGGD